MPTIELENCTGCLKCVIDCPANAINIETGSINNLCIHCGHCVAICPESTVFPDSGEIQELKLHEVSPADFKELSAGIRTCRSYRGTEVDDEILSLLIENMKHYPSASNARPVEVTVVKTKEAIQRLDYLTANKLIRSLKLITFPLLRPFLFLFAPGIELSRLKNYKKQFIERQTPGSSQVCHHAPAVMLFHGPVKKYSLAGDDAYIWSTYTSIFANTMGLGTCFNGFIVKTMERSKAIRREFGIPAGHMIYASLLLGHPKVKYTNEVGRVKPKATFI